MDMVTVVVNTMNRPMDVVHALESVFAQSYPNFEVIVVVDGPEPATEKAVQEYGKGLPDPLRMRVIVNQTNQGLSESRNIASRKANGRWVAYLDDDDRWLPDKLKCQAGVAENLAGDFTLVVSRFINKRDSEEEVAPARLISPGEHFSEYMFCNRGNLIPSTFFMSRELALAYPFSSACRGFEDLDWLLRVAADPETVITVTPDVLTVYHGHQCASRERQSAKWQSLYGWSIQSRQYFTRKAYAYLFAKVVIPYAKENGASLRELLHVALAGILLGTFRPAILFFCLTSIFFDRETKARVRRLISAEARKSVRREPS